MIQYTRPLISQVNLDTSYGYNGLGMVSHIAYPSGTTVDYGYDFGRISSVLVNGQVVADNISYHATGQVQQWNWANGSVYQRQYDLNGRLIAYTDGTDIDQLGYDGNHNITSITSSTTQKTLGYDALNRLTGFQSPLHSIQYQYDANGNRTKRTDDLNVTDYEVDAASNKLLSSSGLVSKVYSHDANGNTISDGQFTFKYDSKNQLATIDNGDTAIYTYNALGQRVYKRAIGNPADLNGDGVVNAQDIQADNAKGASVDCNGDGNATNNQGNGNGQGNVHGKDVSCIATLIGNNANSPKVQAAQTGAGNIELTFVYNEQGRLLGEYDTTGQPQQETVYLNAIPIASVQNGMVYTVHTDHLNTPRALTDANNTVVWRWGGEPFGDTEADEDPDGDGIKVSINQRFAGQYYDTETGLHYNYFRYYDPSTGRYVTSDPIGLRGGLNTYGYVSGNPLFSSDPFGLTEADVFFARYAISRMYPELTNNVDVYSSQLLQYTPWDGYALGENITIESKYAENCLNQQEKEDLKNVLLHEYLHVYLNRQIGAINYLYQDTMSSGQLHDWVREKSAEIRGYWNRTVPIGTPKPVLTDFPKR